METRGRRLPQREEDVTHNSWTANARGGDHVKDTVHVAAKVSLRQEGQSDLSDKSSRMPTLRGHARTVAFLPCLSPGFPIP